jgi:hypothetical protein
VYNVTMKALLTILFLLSTNFALACNATILEQDGKFFLAVKRVGDIPTENEVPEKKLRRGFQEISLVDKKDKESKEPRKARLRIVYDSDDRDVIEKMLKTRCPNN